ncbi:helix-turn-helix transcriptional regulator [Mycoplasmatota bacterium zrk1]
MNSDLKKYFPIADFIAAISGKKTEVLIHDLSCLDKSIIYIVNGEVTNRTIGGTITKLAMELIHEGQTTDQPSTVNYLGTTNKGKNILRSSTYFIRDENGVAIGLLCVNTDITTLLRMRKTVDDLLIVDDKISKNSDVPAIIERFDGTVDEIIKETINSVIFEYGKGETSSEKFKLVEKLEKKGVFKFKGSVDIVAVALEVSIQSVYRYIKSIKGR